MINIGDQHMFFLYTSNLGGPTSKTQLQLMQDLSAYILRFVPQDKIKYCIVLGFASSDVITGRS